MGNGIIDYSEKFALQINGLSKIYRNEVHAVKDLDLNIYEGEVHALLGPNGAGKTTTIKAILGFIAYEGDVKVLGEGIDLVRENVAFVPEEKNFYEFLTPYRTIKICKGIIPQFDENKAFEYMKRFSLPMEKKISSFSNGMKTSLYLSICFAQKASLYIFDEPTWGLDPIRNNDILDMIRDLVIDGKTVLYTSHIISDVEKIADRISVMHEGRRLFTGYVDDIKGDFRVFYLPTDFQGLETLRYLSGKRERERTVILTDDGETIERLEHSSEVEMSVPDMEMFFQILLRGKNYV
ncbi:MAG TPA: ABC transporter ATP-binding protein [Thermotogota bacterium]|nr:ABC transporter ATP-binding protein [Thermotogota bacterium]HPJ88814.1 ABC transporter ATP-binding protein [Thermotogota bacterium]HPR96677.1 ABC transporter ATP-binding protein [Thermotogota bacterium]